MFVTYNKENGEVLTVSKVKKSAPKGYEIIEADVIFGKEYVVEKGKLKEVLLAKQNKSIKNKKGDK